MLLSFKLVSKKFQTTFKQKVECSFEHYFVPRSDQIDIKNVQGPREKVLFLSELIRIDIILGSIVLYVMARANEQRNCTEILSKRCQSKVHYACAASNSCFKILI